MPETDQIVVKMVPPAEDLLAHRATVEAKSGSGTVSCVIVDVADSAHHLRLVRVRHTSGEIEWIDAFDRLIEVHDLDRAYCPESSSGEHTAVADLNNTGHPPGVSRLPVVCRSCGMLTTVPMPPDTDITWG